jgi:hypothetical protein
MQPAWFTQPKGMPMLLYELFRDTVQPIIFQKHDGKLLRPTIFGKKNIEAPASFWIEPPEPTMALEGYRFHPPSLYTTHLFMAHFFV